MNKLNKAICYLCGPIDYAHDDGIGWRKEITKKLLLLGVKILDPTCKVWGEISEVAKEKEKNQKLRREGKFKELAVIAKRMRHEDLRCVDICDFLIAYVDPTVHMCGTYDEIFAAERQKKPILVVVNGGRTSAPVWLFDVFPIEDMFDSFDDLNQRILDINSGSYQMDQRWVLVRDHL